jgi:hypothetical protein
LAFDFAFVAVAQLQSGIHNHGALFLRVARGLTNSEIKPGFIERKSGFIH